MLLASVQHIVAGITTSALCRRLSKQRQLDGAHSCYAGRSPRTRRHLPCREPGACLPDNAERPRRWQSGLSYAYESDRPEHPPVTHTQLQHMRQSGHPTGASLVVYFSQ